MAFAAPGLTPEEILVGVAQPLDFSTATSAQLIRMEQAVTAAAQAACLHNNHGWWFLKDEDAFPTVASTGLYALRTVSTNAMADLYRPTRVFIDSDYELAKGTREDYEAYTTLVDSANNKPTSYALSGDLDMYLWPIPDAVYVITVEYLKRHTKFTLASTASTELVIPAEFHWGVYIDAPLWLLKHDTVDPSALLASPQFAETMQRMAVADPSKVPLTDGDRDSRLFDASRRVFQTAGGLSIP